jgi:hypothetical protein
VPAVVFVAPYFLPTTNRFIASTASLDGVRLGLVTHEPLSKVPEEIRSRLVGHYRSDNALDPGLLHDAVLAVGGQVGGVDRLMGPLEELQIPLAQVRAALGIAGMDVETARNFRDKERMKDVFDRAGVPCARHRLIDSASAAEAFFSEVGFPVVAKPPSGSGTRDTFRLDDPTQAGEWLRWSPPEPGRPTLLEEFITGEEHAFDCVFLEGHPVFWNISRYHPAPLAVMENPWIQWAVILPRDIDGPEYEGISHFGPAAISALGLKTGLVHMEWFRRPDGSVAISEAAARPPGAQFSTLISYAHDFDLYSAWGRLMVYDEFASPHRKYAVGAAYLRGQGDGRVAAVHGLEEVQREVAGLVVEAKLPQPGQAPSGHYEGEGYVIVRHPDTAVVEKAIADIITGIRVELS